MNLAKMSVCAFHFLRERVKVYSLALGFILAASSSVRAASIRACWDTASVTADVATVQLLADTSIVVAVDVLAGATVVGAKSCAVTPFPAVLTRGVDHAMTLRAVNAFGEVGPASGPVTFRPPTIPGALTGVTLQAVVGP